MTNRRKFLKKASAGAAAVSKVGTAVVTPAELAAALAEAAPEWAPP